MSDITPFFPGWRAVLAPMGSRVKSTLGSLKEATLCQIEASLAAGVDGSLFVKPKAKAHSRRRVYCLERVFGCWVWQVLGARVSCREVVRQVQGLFAVGLGRRVGAGTGAYCRSRAKLPLGLLEKVFLSSAASAQKRAGVSKLLQGRPLKVVDGTSLPLEDTPQNHAAFPAAGNQYGSVGFPLVKMLAIFSVASGAIVGRATGTGDQSENRLLKSLCGLLDKGDILMGDRHFGYFALAAWLQQSFGVDLLARVPTGSRRVDFRKAIKVLGKNDALFLWRKPPEKATYFTLQEWDTLPQQLTVRLVKATIENRGFRTREITLVTTLLDPKDYPAEELMAAYLKRWRMEMCLDDLKTTLGMEKLRSHPPVQAQKEILIFLTAHNLIRWIMASAPGDIERHSFKGTLDTFRQWSIAMAAAGRKKKAPTRTKLWEEFLTTIAADKIPIRPERREPRAVKKKTQKYPYLSSSRKTYREPLSRTKRRILNNYMKNHPKP